MEQIKTRSLWEDPQYADFLKREWAGHGEDNVGHPQQIIKALGGNWDQPGVRLLDVGCGTGRLARYFKKAQYFGVDLSAEMVSQCQDQGLQVRQGPIYKIPFADHSFDLVICNAVLFHIGHLREAINELWRVTKDSLAFSCYWDYWFYRPFNPGPSIHMHEDLETGLARWVPANRPPAWQVKWFTEQLPELRQVHYTWLGRKLIPCRHRVVIVTASR